MKYIVLCLSIFAFSQHAFSQNKQKGINLENFTMDISLNTGLPVMKMKGSSIGIGPAYHLGYILNEKIAVSGNIGYNRFGKKGKNGSPANYFYLLGGGHYFVQPAIHIDVFAGYASFKGTAAATPFTPNGLDFNNNGPAVAVGAGYRLTKIWDVSARFQKSKTVSYIGLSLALRFDR